ncbi:MAG: type II secretion system protein GspJ [Phycisphaerales bacterium]|nr:type II secretion system protein GspJ [Phycisphaerales bacterium]
MNRNARRTRRRGFTMIELILAAVLMALLLAAMGLAMQQIVKSRNAVRGRIEAHLRADAALSILRRDLVSVLRRTDLYYTRVLVEDRSTTLDGSPVDRDDILVFNNRLQATRDIEYNGDGLEFETQYRIEDDDLGSVLLQRRDAMPDAYPRGGGLVMPAAEGIIGMSIEAWDGRVWHTQWDSDRDGLPWALRVTVEATGAPPGESTADHPVATLRTVVPLDRSTMPIDVADSKMAWELMERFGVDSDQEDAFIAAVAAASPPPMERETAGDGSLTGGPGQAGSSGQGGMVIDTPEGQVIISNDGSSATLQGGSGQGGPR